MIMEQEIKTLFSEDLARLRDGGYDDWTDAYNGLAAVLLADQFTR